MYEHFFELKRKPFELVPNPDFLFMGATHKKAMTYLNYVVQERTGFMLLTGEVGSGKTTLLRDFINRLDHRATLAKVFNTKVNFEQLLAMINDDFGLDSAGKNKVTLLKELNQFLVEEHGKGRSPILIIDEAQNFTPTVLEEVRLLSNLETHDAKLLQIILVGQPELAEMLSLTELRQLRQRISIVCHLYPLTRAECEEYIHHRLAIAGNRNAVQFSPEAIDSIYSFSTGIPRLMNIICNFLLLTAFAEETKTIDHEMVADIIKDLQGETSHSSKNDMTEGKRALLHALGTSSAEGEGRVAPAPAMNSQNGEKNTRLLLKDISLRVTVLEKDHARVQAHDLDGMARRLELLEKSAQQAASRSKVHIAPTAPPQNNDRTQPALAGAASPQKEPDTKRGFFKRIVGAG
jgi:putative secretion ATPase (PEP-CTERM system associated)